MTNSGTKYLSLFISNHNDILYSTTEWVPIYCLSQFSPISNILLVLKEKIHPERKFETY